MSFLLSLPFDSTDAIGYVSVCVGQLQLPQMTHADSLIVSEIVDEILQQIGVHYDAEWLP